MMAIDPNMVVIGGGLSLANEVLIAPLRRKVEAEIGLPINVPMAAARFGGEAAVHGAWSTASLICLPCPGSTASRHRGSRRCGRILWHRDADHRSD